MKYYRKPGVVEAYQYNGKNHSKLVDFVGSNRIALNNYDILSLMTTEGEKLVRKGDFIIKDEKGEISSCSPDIFKANYESKKKIKPYIELPEEEPSFREIEKRRAEIERKNREIVSIYAMIND